MKTYYLPDALDNLARGACWVCQADETGEFNYADIDWQDEEIAKPTAEAIQAEIDRLTAAEPMRYLREVRDAKLAETDVWALGDRTMTAEQTAYRQALRDLPANTTDPANPVWPTKPE